MAKKTGIFSWSKGSGKTTTCAYLAAALATLHRKVVCVDLNGDLGKYFAAEEVQAGGLTWKYRKWKGEGDLPEDDADDILVDIPSGPGHEAVLEKLDSVLIPVEAEYYGTAELNRTLQAVAQHEHLVIEGMLLTKVKPGSGTPHKMEAELKEYFSPFLLNSDIMRNYYLARPEFSLTDLNRKGWHSGFIAYLKLANELLEHEC